MLKQVKKIILIILALSLVITMVGCSEKDVKDKENGNAGVEDNNENNENIGGEKMALEQLEAPKAGEEIAVITTNHGEIKVRFFPEVAPKAVENFKTHANKGYYNGIIFHRIIKDFMIQGGDPTGTGMGGESIWGSPFEDEFDINYRNFRGSLSMANAGAGTNGSQFFIVQAANFDPGLISQMRDLGEEAGYPEAVVDAYEELGGAYWLDFKHTVFGQVFEGMDIVDNIANLETGTNDKPVEDVVMEKVEIVEYK